MVSAVAALRPREIKRTLAIADIPPENDGQAERLAAALARRSKAPDVLERGAPGGIVPAPEVPTVSLEEVVAGHHGAPRPRERSLELVKYNSPNPSTLQAVGTRRYLV